jgi:hypothetical protein
MIQAVGTIGSDVEIEHIVASPAHRLQRQTDVGQSLPEVCASTERRRIL